MDDTEDKASESLSVGDALKMYEDYKSYWQENYDEARTDLNFSIGKDHWDEKDVAARNAAGKASLVVNVLPQYIHQVTNDIRQNTPNIKVLPESDGDIETADIFSGLIRGIEYASGADEVYDTAAEYAVKCGIGFFRVDHDYCDDNSDEQELILKSVPDPLSVFNDPASVDSDGRDANGQIGLEAINKKDFERLYPGKNFVSFVDPKDKAPKDSIILGNIYIREATGKHGKTYIVHSYKFSGEDLLAKSTFPGMYCPYVPIYGEVVWIDGKRILGSLIRQARDPQRRINHWASKESEILSMAPIAPVMAPVGVVVNDRGQWQKPGSEMLLEYNTTDIDGNPAPQPTRLAPPPIPTGIINAMNGAKEDVKESMGIYSAGLGKREGDASGVALKSLQNEGDVATFHFPDNVRRSVTQGGRILVKAAPIVYDTPRIVQIVNEETDPQMVGINGAPMQEGQTRAYDLTKGSYHVRVATGASYSTRRQEAAQLFGDVIKQNPQLLNVIGDLWAKNLDVAGAQAMAERFEKMIPPQLKDSKDQPQIPPQLQQAIEHMQQLIQQGAQEIQQLQQQLASKQAEEQGKMADIQLKGADLQLKGQDLTQKNKVDAMNAENARMKLQLDAEKLQLERDKLMLDHAKAMKAGEIIPEKTPEEEQAEQDQVMILQQQEADDKARELAESHLKAEQMQAAIVTLGAIAQQLNQLTTQVSQPKKVVRNEDGVILGVQ